MNKELKIYWQEPIEHQRLHIGTLSYLNGIYKFNYVRDYRKLEEKGFIPIMPFLDFETEYVSDKLFPAFSCRLPDPKRKDIGVILKKYNLTEYDSFELLSRSEGRSPSDRLEFISEIDLSQPFVSKEFFIAGVSHGEFCTHTECIKDVQCLDGIISLLPEPNNPYDSNAVRIMVDGKKLGYIPLYHSKAVSTAINSNMSINCKIVEINFTNSESKNCRDCIKMQIDIHANS